MNANLKASVPSGYYFWSGTVHVDNGEVWDGGIWLGITEDSSGESARVIMSTGEVVKLAKKLLKAAREIERRDRNGEA